MKTKSVIVCIHEVKELVWGDEFGDSYATTVTMSDGSKRNIKLTRMTRDGEECVEYNMNGHISYLRTTSTNISGDGETQKALMLQLFEVPSDASNATVTEK